MIYGLDHLGIAKYERGLAAREHPQGWALGAFGTGVFGDSRNAVQEVLETGRCPLFRLQALWSDNHTFGPQSLKDLRAELRKWQVIFKTYEGRIAMCVSWACEHQSSQQMVMEALNIVKGEIPSAHFVNAPYGKGAVVQHRDIINEVHGTGKRALKGRYFFSYDGSNAFDSDVEADKRAHPNAEVFFWWVNQFNGNRNGNPKDKLPRPQRTWFPKGQLGSHIIDATIYLKNSKGKTSLPADWTQKSVGDQDKKPNPRDCQFLFIAPKTISLIQLKAKNGQVIGQAKRGEVFDHDSGRLAGTRSIFRFGDFGYLLAEKARRINDVPLCDIFADGRKVGVCNPAFRDGGFR